MFWLLRAPPTVRVDERQVFYSPGVYQLRHRCAGGLDERRLAGDRHLLRDLADLQLVIHDRRAAYGQFDSGANTGLEPGCAGAHFIPPNGKVGGLVAACRAGRGVSRNARIRILDGYRRPGNGGPGRVGDGPRDGPRG